MIRFAVAVLTASAATAASPAVLQGKGSTGVYLSCGYALAMVLNAAFSGPLGNVGAAP